MAKIQLIHVCSLLLSVIVTYHDILFYAEGRLIKSLNKDANWSPPPPLEPVKDSVRGRKEVSPPMMPNYKVDDSTAVFEDYFRPTPPGSSPGVGHHSVPNKEDVPAGAAGGSSPTSVRHSVTAADKDDYRPTDPGHSPGVGHALQKTNAEPNS